MSRAARVAPLTPALVLVALSVPLLLWRLGSYSLVNGDEAIYHAIAEHMVESGDWLRLEFESQHRVYDTFMNAPLQYWARAILIHVFGSNLWTTRILSALFGVATVLLVQGLGARLAGRAAGFLAGLALLGTLQFVYLHSARTGELETVLCFFLVLAAWLFVRALEGRGGFLLHHACVAVLLGLKLPLAAVPALAELAYFAVKRSARPRFAHWCASGFAVLPFALLWHAYQWGVLGDAALRVFATMFGQASGTLGPQSGGGLLGNAAYYLSVVAFGAHPLAFAYAPAVAAVLARARGPEAAYWRVLGLFALALLLFYVAVSKHTPWYVIPLYPFLSLYLGAWLASLATQGLRSFDAAALGAVAACALLASLPIANFHPFVVEALWIPMPLGWRSVAGIPPAVFVPCAAVTSATLAVVVVRRLAERLSRSLALAFVVGLLGTGLVRVSFPLRHLGHQSEVALLQRDLAERRSAGLAIETPIELPNAPFWVIRYYFADDFDIVVRPRPAREPFNSRGGIFELCERGRSCAPRSGKEPSE